MMNQLKILISIFLLAISTSVHSKDMMQAKIVVSADGSGDFTSINEAILSLPYDNFQRTIIFVKDGHYKEKVRIEKNCITLKGESRDGTIIEYKQYKKAWDNDKDYEGPAVLNIHADDVIIEHLTIRNLAPEIGPNAYAIYGSGTRTIFQHCTIKGNGANTVSLMNYTDGMYYFNDCSIEGTVDFMRAMGWCYMNNCRFYQKEAIASIWHARITDESQKMLIKNSEFDGVTHFFLGRHHHDAQFYLINCRFSERLADKAIYRKTYVNNPPKNKADIFGDSYKYMNCSKEGETYAWLKDKMDAGDYAPSSFTACWTFNKMWDPESIEPPQLMSTYLKKGLVYLTFNEALTVHGELILENANGISLQFLKGQGRQTLCFKPSEPFYTKDLEDGLSVISGIISASAASTIIRKIQSPLKH